MSDMIAFIKLLKKAGMATGCIIFKYCYLLTLSGFFVTETLFITAAHFNNDTNKPCQDGMPEDEVYQALQTEGNGIAQVNIRRFPTSMSSKVLPFLLNISQIITRRISQYT